MLQKYKKDFFILQFIKQGIHCLLDLNNLISIVIIFNFCIIYTA